MLFQQYFLGCLSHASYLIGDTSSGRAVVVDPQRDVSGYLTDAVNNGVRIERVIETHFHADFLSGHLEVAAETGAVISYGAAGHADFPIEVLQDGQRLSLGEVTLEVLATPGHTPESICVLVYERADDKIPYGVLTGDTLFIGDVGRPDLLASQGSTADQLARLLYRSLHDKLLPLPDETRVFPAHGAGSSCGKHLSTETESTLGYERATNYALAPMTEEAFVSVVTEGQPARPLYFSYDAQRNRELRPLLDEHEPPAALDLAAVRALQESGGAVLDTRDPADFAALHLHGSLNVSLRSRFAEFAGDVLRPGELIALVCDPGQEREAKVRLARIGFDSVIGALAEPLRTLADHPEMAEPSSRLTAADLAARLNQPENTVLIDVRNPGEVAGGMIDGAVNIPLPRLLDAMDGIDRGHPVVVYCASGMRSSTGASALAAAGHSDVSDLLGGYEAWRAVATP
jgi:glyoxylase-like metal-dependent hydrolase (beta-lactamase superfamily II)/rhodanese-related sulfurtransferase